MGMEMEMGASGWGHLDGGGGWEVGLVGRGWRAEKP